MKTNGSLASGNHRKIEHILVFTPTYNENIGGVIMLHKLSDQLNRAGVSSFIFPYFDNTHENLKTPSQYNREYLQAKLLKAKNSFEVNGAFRTSLLEDTSLLDDLDKWAVVYPEVVSGNPLGAKNVIRWFLHYPGFHTGIINYGDKELYFKVSSEMQDFHYKNSKVSDVILKFLHYPLELYNLDDVSKQRKGTAYCLHKGKDKEIQHDLRDSILIDGKSHKEIAEIFKAVEMFISYDAHTSYIAFAILCGCKTVVIKDNADNEKVWRRDLKNQYGIVYGLENQDKAKVNSSVLLNDILCEASTYEKLIQDFSKEVDEFFL